MPNAIAPRTDPPDSLEEPLDIGEVYSLGWSLMGSNYGLLLGISLLFVLLNAGIGVSLAILDRASPTLATILNLASSLFFMPPLTAGVFFMGVRMFREEPIALEQMFAGFSRYWVVVGINLIMALLIVCCLIPGGVLMIVGFAIAPAGNTVGLVTAICGMAVMIAMVIFISIRLAYATMACLDPQNGYPGVMDSLVLTWRATAPVAGRLLLLYVLVSLTILATLLLLCIGLPLLGYPFGLAVCGVAYVAVFGPLHRALDEQEQSEFTAPPDGHPYT